MAAIRTLWSPGLASARRGMSTNAKVMAARPRIAASEVASASQPVFKRDVPPAPAPRRPTLPKRPEQPATDDSPTSRRGGKEGSVLASYKALPYRTKLVFWTCGAMFAALGLLVADKLEELFPARNNKSARSSRSNAEAKFIDHPSSPDETSSEATKPKLFAISVVDRKTQS